jgi:two-component system, cell cycle sensor histidine kinase and response regulator CckA
VFGASGRARGLANIHLRGEIPPVLQTLSLTQARTLAPGAFRRWVLGSVAIIMVGYASVALIVMSNLGLLASLTSRNASMALICALALVFAARVNVVGGAGVALLATWLELETAFISVQTFPPAGLLILPVVMLGVGLLFGARVALIATVLTIAATFVTCLMSPALQAGVPLSAQYWLMMHIISMLTTWVTLVLGMSAYARVFEAMEQNERDLADTIRFAPDGVLVATHDGTIVLANPMSVSLLSRPAEQLIGRTVQDVLRDATGEAAPLEVIPSQPHDAPIALTIPGPNGESVSLELSRRHMERNRDQFLLRDVTQHVRADEQRRGIEQQLSHAQRLEAIGRLAGGLSHDFNNILTAVSGSAEMLRIEQVPSERSALLDEIIAARDRGVSLTSQLLAFARREVTQPRVIDLAEHVRGLERLLRRVAGDRHRVSFALEADCHVRVDPGQLEQALVNLVSNARDAMPHSGRCTITVERVTGPAPTSRVLMHVDDDGVGMTDDIAARAFEPFFTTKRRGQGTGLGLASVHGMVAQSSGSARITTRVPCPTRVTLEFPWADEPATIDAAISVASASPRGPQSILVAEDDSGTRRVVERILRQAGYVVRTVPDGTEAMAMINDMRVAFDLLLSDVMMPGHTGPELADRMQTVRPDTPILLMTGYAEEQLGDLIEHRARREVITKPFSADALTSRIAALISASAEATRARA